MSFKVYASCHNHSTFSDGEYSPELLARMAKNMGHGGIILTDHDTVQGYPFIKKAADSLGLKTVIGVELSTHRVMKDGRNRGIHLLGFDFDPEHPALKDYIPECASIQTARSHVLFDMAKADGRLRGDMTWEDVLSDHPDHNYICNNEVFESLLKRGIYLRSEYDEFFRTCFWVKDPKIENMIVLMTGKSYLTVKTEDAVRRIKEAGGVPVVAHPHGFVQYTDELLEIGVMGFETRHSTLSPEEHIHFEEVCRSKGLYRMGGSDHENVLGGLLAFGDNYSSAYEMSGIDEESFNALIERRLG